MALARSGGVLNSLQAKAGVSLAKIHEKLGNLKEAEELCRDAVNNYEAGLAWFNEAIVMAKIKHFAPKRISTEAKNLVNGTQD